MITLPVWKCILPVMRKIRENTGKISGGQMSFTKLPWLCPRLFIDLCLLWTKSFRRNAGHWFPNCYFYYLLWWYNWVECFWVLHQLFPQPAGPWFKPSILPLTRFVPSVYSWILRIVYWFYHHLAHLARCFAHFYWNWRITHNSIAFIELKIGCE